MKGQSTIEFLTGLFLFLIALVGSLTLMSDQVPEFTEDVEESSQNMEMYRLTTNMLTKSGRHNFKDGGTEWEKNSSTVGNTTQFGLAEDYFVLDKDKIDALSTTGQGKFNYSQFRDINDLDNQYFFNFTWMPIVESSKSFTRTQPPPGFNEPDDDPAYSNAENRVHYGNFRIAGDEYPFLVVAFNGVYNTVYFDTNRDYNFFESNKRKLGETVKMNETEFKVEQIQNRKRKPGTSVILSTHLKSFGANLDGARGSRTKLNRYASLKAQGTDKEVVRIEVIAW